MNKIENFSINQNPDDNENKYGNLIESLDPIPAVAKIRNLVEVEGDMTHEEAIIELEQLAIKRRRVLDVPIIEQIGEGKYEIDTNEAINFIKNIQIVKGNMDAFLGNGAVAEVSSLETIENKGMPICAKFIINENRYIEGNSINKEAHFLDLVRNLEVSGVRSPRPLYVISTHELKFLVMEELQAINFRRIIENQTTKGVRDELPANFNVDVFFNDLKDFVLELHKNGIYHCDIALRNIMIDRETGKPRLIDYGKSKLEIELDKTNTSQADWAKLDLAALESARLEAKKYLAAQ